MQRCHPAQDFSAEVVQCQAEGHDDQGHEECHAQNAHATETIQSRLNGP